MSLRAVRARQSRRWTTNAAVLLGSVHQHVEFQQATLLIRRSLGGGAVTSDLVRRRPVAIGGLADDPGGQRR